MTEVAETKNQELNNNQFVFEEKIVTVTFSYNDEKVEGWKIEASGKTFQSDAVEVFNEELFGKVCIAVELFKAKREKILSERVELKRQQNIKEHEEEINDFKNFVDSVVPESFWDLKPIFQTPRDDKWNTTRITFEDEQWELTYNAEKDIGGRYSSGRHLVKNNRPWTLEFSYSDKRQFKKIETALKRIQERLDTRKQNKTDAEQKTEALQQLSNQTSMTIKTETTYNRNYSRTNRRSCEHLYLVPTDETESSTPSIKVHVSYYSPNDIRLGTIELYKKSKIGDFEAHKRVSVSSQFDNDVKGFLTFLKQLTSI